MELKRIEELIETINSTNGSNEKMELLKQFDDCKELLNYIYNEFKQYNVTSANLKKRNDLVEEVTDLSITELLDFLESREITGHKAISVCNGFVAKNKQYEDVIHRIIDKDLKIGMGVSNINKVFKDLIPTFDVALANSYDKVKNVDITEFYASRKLDGLRCVAIKKGNNVNFYSRKGKEFFTLDVVKEDLLKIKGNFVFDGELCIVDENGNEDFTAITKLYKKKDFTIPNPRYKVFDCLTIEEFESKTSKRILSQRIENLKLVFDEYDCPTIDIVEQIKLTEEAFTELQKKASDEGWEGLIIRRDVGYKGKRSNDLLKVKKFHDAEYTVNDIETGMFQVIDNGNRIEIETLTAVYIEHKGFKVKVGSGFSIDERKEFFSDPSKIIGKEITVQYFEESHNEKGGTSLRFPTVKHIYRDGKRDV